MSLKGTFKRQPRQRLHNIMGYSFTLKCTNWLSDETVDVAIIPSNGDQPCSSVTKNCGQASRMTSITIL